MRYLWTPKGFLLPFRGWAYMHRFYANAYIYQMKFTYRRAFEVDIPVMSGLGHKIWHEHYPGIITVDQINFMLKDRYSHQAILDGMKNGEQYFLVFASNEAVALADIELKEGYYYLHKFYVDVSKHRSGIGTGFFNYILEQIDATKPIRLQVNRLNYKAINFYFKNGFVIEKTGDFDIGGGYFMNDFVMIRKPEKY
jgi:GNAT superfamily N-acetyltransferase